MLTSLFIIGVSAVLFGYWFRYTCSLILSTHASEDYSQEVVEANHLSFPWARKEISKGSGVSLAEIQNRLDRDFLVLTCLLRHSGRKEVSLEQAMLRADFHGLKLWSRLSRSFSRSAARGALLEMTSILAHLANCFAEEATASPNR
jgi:hypothetical protein